MAKDSELIAIITFHNKASGPQAFLAFSKKFKHCSIITFDGTDWIWVEFDVDGILTRVVPASAGAEIITRLKRMKSVQAIVTVKIFKRKSVPWWPLWGRTCSELVRYVSGADVGKTFNPIHLYKKLLKYNNKRNYEILFHWTR